MTNSPPQSVAGWSRRSVTKSQATSGRTNSVETASTKGKGSPR